MASSKPAALVGMSRRRCTEKQQTGEVTRQVRGWCVCVCVYLECADVSKACRLEARQSSMHNQHALVHLRGTGRASGVVAVVGLSPGPTLSVHTVPVLPAAAARSTFQTACTLAWGVVHRSLHDTCQTLPS